MMKSRVRSFLQKRLCRGLVGALCAPKDPLSVGQTLPWMSDGIF